MATNILAQNLGKTDIVEQDDILVGPLLTPTNSAKHLGAGSIHDDATAQKLGFRGGTVAGSLHMEQFPPIATRIFGDEWWQSGGLSLYFRYATADLEPVRCFAKAAPQADGNIRKANTWMEDDADHLVAEGTINVGGFDPESPLRLRIRDTPAPEDIRILDHVKVGSRSDAIPVRVEAKHVADRLAVITAPMDVYNQTPAALPPSLFVRIMRPAESVILPRHDDIGVGLFGAIEIQHLSGPVHADTDYDCTATVLALGETPKTEYLWYETRLTDKSGKDVAGMLMMLRFMKAS
ncbi:MAG: hypothetical protein KDI19_13330, partial [Pseudomonadales bacterium]|nr:hypothetical protein [Pseudomonadales bacterium]